MGETSSVKVSSRYQISLPSAARKRLNIQSGDRLLVDVQGDIIILLPQPENYTAHMAGLHQDVWQDVETDRYLQQERAAWLTTSDDD